MKLDRITFEPNKLGGKACIRGMRFSVSQVLRLLAGGATVDELLREYPSLEAEDIAQCLVYAADLAEEGTYLPALGTSKAAAR